MKNLERALLLKALESSHLGICVLDSAGRAIMISDIFAEKLKINRETSLGRNYMALFSVVHRDIMNRLCDVNREEERLEYSIDEGNSQERHVVLQSSNIDHAGETFRVVTMLELVDFGLSKDRFQQLQRQLESVSNAVVVVDAKAPDMPIIAVNEQFLKMTGYDAQESVGRNCRFLQNGAQKNDAELAVLRGAIKGGQPCSVILNNIRKDGSSFKNELFMTPAFDQSGELTHFVGIQHVKK